MRQSMIFTAALLCLFSATSAMAQRDDGAQWMQGFEPEPPPKLVDNSGHPIETPSAQDIRELKKTFATERNRPKIDPGPKCEGFFKNLPEVEKQIAKLEKDRYDLLYNEDGSPKVLDKNEEIRLKQLTFAIEKTIENKEKGIDFCAKVLGGRAGTKCPEVTGELDTQIDKLKTQMSREIFESTRTSGAEREKHTQAAAELGKQIGALEAERAQKEAGCESTKDEPKK